MEIIIRDEKMPKNCYECSYLKLCSLNTDIKPTISKCPLKPLSQHDLEIRVDERNCIYDEMPKILADSIIEITEPLDKLEFYDLEKIARKFEQKLTELLTPNKKGEKDEYNSIN